MLGSLCQALLGPPVVPLYPFLGKGSLTKIDYRRKVTLILTTPQEDLDSLTNMETPRRLPSMEPGPAAREESSLSTGVCSLPY